MEELEETDAAGYIEKEKSCLPAAKIFQHHFKQLYKAITREPTKYELICKEMKCLSDKPKPLLVCIIQAKVLKNHKKLRIIGVALQTESADMNRMGAVILHSYNEKFQKATSMCTCTCITCQKKKKKESQWDKLYAMISPKEKNYNLRESLNKEINELSTQIQKEKDMLSLSSDNTQSPVKIMYQKMKMQIQQLESELKLKQEKVIECTNTIQLLQDEISSLSVKLLEKEKHKMEKKLEKHIKTTTVTRDIANNTPSYNNDKLQAVSEALNMHINDLKKTISESFESIISACEQEKLIAPEVKQSLLDSSATKIEASCTTLICYIQKLIGINPNYLSTFLDVLRENNSIEVANSVAKTHYQKK
jgi:hypothetical protein